MATINETVTRVLAAATAQPTKEEQANTARRIALSSALFASRSTFQAQTEPQRRMREAARLFAGRINFDRNANWLVMLGPSGIGKTHLAREVWRHFMEWSRFEVGFDATRQRVTGNTGQFCDWRRLCADVRGGSYGRIDDLEQDSFVVLDDIGSEHDPSGFIASALDRICNTRSRAGDAKWTLITCNLFLDQIAQRIDPRIADRMLRNGSVIVESEGESFSL